MPDREYKKEVFFSFFPISIFLLKSSVFLRHERPKKKDSFRNVSFTMNIVLQEQRQNYCKEKM